MSAVQQAEECRWRLARIVRLLEPRHLAQVDWESRLGLAAEHCEAIDRLLVGGGAPGGAASALSWAHVATKIRRSQLQLPDDLWAWCEHAADVANARIEHERGADS